MNELNRFKTKVMQYGTSKIIRATKLSLGEVVYVFTESELDFLKQVIRKK